MKIAILSGSVRDERQSHKVAYFLKRVLEKRHVKADLIDLAKEPLPIRGHKQKTWTFSNCCICFIPKHLSSKT